MWWDRVSVLIESNVTGEKAKRQVNQHGNSRNGDRDRRNSLHKRNFLGYYVHNLCDCVWPAAPPHPCQQLLRSQVWRSAAMAKGSRWSLTGQRANADSSSSEQNSGPRSHRAIFICDLSLSGKLGHCREGRGLRVPSLTSSLLPDPACPS